MPTQPLHQTVAVGVGPVTIGGDAPIVVQSMTNTDTADAAATAAQAGELARAGSELVRVTVNNDGAAAAVPEIRQRLDDQGLAGVPLVGDFHYRGHLLLTAHPPLARALGKYRINPGNVGVGARQDDNFRTVIQVALDADRPVRIGVNWGSLDRRLVAELLDDNARRSSPLPLREVQIEAMIASALRSAAAAEGWGLPRERIVLSVKTSRPRDLWTAYERLAGRTNHALHLGLTEAGLGPRAIAASAVALAPLLARGIGDTIRVSLTPEPGASRTLEVQVCQSILQSLELRTFSPTVTACPGCGRTSSERFCQLARQVEDQLRAWMPEWRERYPGVEQLKVAVMGCVVNGPGESRHADIGISLPGAGENPRAPVYVAGELAQTLEGPRLAEDFLSLIEAYVERRFGRDGS